MSDSGADVLDVADDLAGGVEGGAEGGAEAEASERKTDTEKARRRLSFSFRLRSLLIGCAIVALVAATGVMSWLYLDARGELASQARQTEDNSHAEKAALDYAVNAASMNFQDMNGWKTKLVAGTSPELREKLSKAATSMEQILVPLQWTSTSTPLAAKVRAHTGSAYVVDAFVSVLTKTTQAPDALQSTATYSITLDSDKDWQIGDVGGIGAVAGPN